VPKVACFSAAGIELWFNTHDHLPPHFHAEKTREWQVRVFFMRDTEEMFDVVYSTRTRRPSRADLKEIAAQAKAHRMRLLEQWEAAVDVKAPGSKR
jgi:Domain of unknown function (DUF4160)